MTFRLFVAMAASLLTCGFASAGSPRQEAFTALTGTWTVTAAEQGGKPFDAIKGGRLTISGETFQLQTASGNQFEGTLRLDTTVSPHHIDFNLSTGAVWRGIYTVNATTFRLNYVEDGQTKRPAVFATTADTPGTVIVMRKS